MWRDVNLQHRSRLVNLETVLLVVLVALTTTMILVARSYTPDARRFPTFVAAVMLVLSLYVLIKEVVLGKGRTEAPTGGERPVVSWVQTTLVTVGFLLVTAGFGMGTGLLLFICVYARLLGLAWTRAILYGAIFSVIVWFAFGTLLQVPLPVGAVFHLY
jgi:energy-converting hydrogenase Eha subunit E